MRGEIERRALFLDRDGVVNKAYIREGKSYPPQTLQEFVFLEKVPESLVLSKELGFLNIIVTNQPDIGGGRQSLEIVEEMHDRVRKALEVDDIFICPHEEGKGCCCRKPLPGMLEMAAKKWNINLKESFLVGDRWRDIQAAQAVGCCAFFINYQYNEKKPEPPYQGVSSLFEAVQKISKLVQLNKE